MFLTKILRWNLTNKSIYDLFILNQKSAEIAAVTVRQYCDDTPNPERKRKKSKFSRKKTKGGSELFIDNVTEEKKENAKENLWKLMNSITSDENLGQEAKTTVQVPIAQKKPNAEKASLMSTKSEYLMKLVKSANSVGEMYGSNKKETVSDLLEVVKKFNLPDKKHVMNEDKTFALQKKSLKIKNIVKNINLVEQPNKDECNILDFFKNHEKLGIFTQKKAEEFSEVKLKLWDRLEKEHLEYLVTNPPKNYYEEMIQWTKQGKLWHFPIDNDQGMEEEAAVDFTEHIFLDEYLEPWCPKAGPIRHFMELVLVGLSKNPYLTVQEKKEHIEWFNNYFEGKKKLLSELGAYAIKKVDAQ